VIGALLVFSAGLGFYQERHGKQAVALLRSQLTVSARSAGTGSGRCCRRRAGPR
jgi:hypothetical protein